MTIHFDFAVRKNCWNFYDSYGEICIHCGCCSADPIERANARLKVCEEQLNERLNFDNWIEGMEELQRKNIASDIRYFKRRIRYYRKRLKELEGSVKQMPNIKNIAGLWCDDITFCQMDCEDMGCLRNKHHIRDRQIPHSYFVDIPPDCPKKEGNANETACT